MTLHSFGRDVEFLVKGAPARWIVFCLVPLMVSHRELLARFLERIASDDRLASLYTVPLVSLLMLWRDTERDYPVQGAWRGIAGVACALGVVSGVLRATLFQGEWASVVEWAVVVFSLAAGFGLFYGWASLRSRMAAFSLLAFTAPPPEETVTFVEGLLQRGSADLAGYLISVLGVTYIREGMVFFLPGITVEVARECSGVRSAIALVIAAFVFGRLMMRTNASRLAVIVWAVPVAIIKNAIRIAVLATLAVWSSPDVLHGPLHQYGGLVFGGVAIPLFAPVVLSLLHNEGRRKNIQQVHVSTE